MDCDICSRRFAGRRKPLCVSCAQAILYEHRVQQLTALLDREKSHVHAEAIIQPGNDGVLASLPDDADLEEITGGIKKYAADCSLVDAASSSLRVDQILERTEELKKQIEGYKTTAATVKDNNERHRQALAAECSELEKHRSRALDPLHSTIKKASQRVEKVRSRIIEARILLCREAALASNLQRRKGANGRSEYLLGGIVIPDLRELNVKTQPLSKPSVVGGRLVAAPFELVSEAIDHVARLLNIIAHYLSVRLPAEILLPHEDFPRSVIMSEKSSYKSKLVQSPGGSTSQASTPTASRVLEQNVPRPRNLWLAAPLSQLHKEDVKSFGMFVEGVMLLAWNLAWLCRAQGLGNINTFEDVCAIGRNLWQLLMSQPRSLQRPALDRKFSTTTNVRDEQIRETRLGLFSHNSAQYNLATANGLEMFRDWKLIKGARLIDQLKSFLVSEISGAEWDLLEKREWDEEPDDEQPVLVGGSNRLHESKFAAMSIMTVAHHDTTEDEQTSAPEGRPKSNSGWMKVRGRGGD